MSKQQRRNCCRPCHSGSSWPIEQRARCLKCSDQLIVLIHRGTDYTLAGSPTASSCIKAGVSLGFVATTLESSGRHGLNLVTVVGVTYLVAMLTTS